MNMRKLAYTLMTLSFILIMSGGVSSFVLGLKKDREVTFKRQCDVNDTFEVFSTNTTIFENYRDELYNGVLNVVYLDSMYAQDKVIKEKLSNYEQLVDELTKNTNELNQLCEGMIYPDNVANTRCKNYKSIYEQVNNYFVADIHTYNQNIKKYNDYQESSGTIYRLRSYETGRDYIDYNLDNQFDGKEE